MLVSLASRQAWVPALLPARRRTWTGRGRAVDQRPEPQPRCSHSPHMMGFGTHLLATCPQMGALIHTFSGLIHTRFIVENRPVFSCSVYSLRLVTDVVA